MFSCYSAQKNGIVDFSHSRIDRKILEVPENCVTNLAVNHTSKISYSVELVVMPIPALALLAVWSRKSDVDVLITFSNHFTSLDSSLTTRSAVDVSYLQQLQHISGKQTFKP